MKRSKRIYQRAIVRSWFFAMTAGLIVAAAHSTTALAQDTPPAAKDDKKPKATKKVQERIFSGPQPGERIKPFKVLHVKAEATKQLEVAKVKKLGERTKTDKPTKSSERIKNDKRTTLICFVHKLSTDDRILYGLGLVDFYLTKHKDISSHFVLLSKEREKMTKMLRGWARGRVFKKSVVSLSADGAEGPGSYGLNRNVAMTVVVARGDKVVSNLVFKAVNAKDLEKIMVEVAKASGKPVPKLAKVQQELRAERQAAMTKRIEASPVFKIAPNEQLGRTMFFMVNGRGNLSRVANFRTKQLREWAGDNKERNAELKKYCNAVLDGDFKLNRYAKEALQKLAGE